MTRNHTKALAHADRARELDPRAFNAPDEFVRLFSGQPALAAANLREFIRREPRHQDWVAATLGSALRRLGKLDEAQHIFESLLVSRTRSVQVVPWALRDLTIIAVQKNDLDRAKSYVKRSLNLRPDASISRITRSLYYDKDLAALEREQDALRKADMPEHSPGEKPQ